MSKPIHMAAQCDDKGNVSALCFRKPRKVNLKIATWTLRADAVTCPACLARLTSLPTATARSKT